MTTWTERRASDLIDGLRAGVSVRSISGKAGGPAVLKTSAIKAGRFDPRESKPILPADLPRAKCPVAADSIIISRMNTPALVGDVGYVEKDFDSLFLPDRLWIARSKHGSGTDIRWLTYHFSSQAGARALRELATGTSGSMKNIPKDKVLGLKVLTPTPPEQRAIADALTDADKLINSLERLISKKQAIKQGMMQELLTGRKRLPGFTRPWKNISIARHSHLKARIGWQGLTTGEYLQSGSYKLVGGTDFKNARIDWNSASFVSKWRFDQDRNIQLQLNDVLITKDGTIGKVAIVDHLPFPATLNSGVFVVRPIRGAYESRFLYWLLRSSVFEKFISSLSAGSTINHLYQKDLIALNLDFPEDFSEQREISNILDDADSEIRALESRLESARNIKQGMMQELLTGRVRLPVGGQAR